MKQHYLPECYSKEFSFDRKLYAIDIYPFRARKKKVFPEIKSLAQVARSKDFYTIKPEISEQFKSLEGKDLYELERSFNYENHYSSVIEKIKKKQQAIIMKDCRTLGFALVDFKIRNNFFRKNAIKKSQEVSVKEVLEDYRKITEDMDYSQFPNLDKAKALAALEKMKEEFTPDDKTFQATHIWSQITRKDEGYKLHNMVIDMLLTYKWQILIRKNAFITNDNPGGSLDDNGTFQNTKYDKNVVVFLPITPSMCLVVDYKEIDEKFGLNKAQKYIHYKHVTKKVSDFVNAYHTVNFNQHLFSYDRDLAIEISDNINLQIESNK